MAGKPAPALFLWHASPLEALWSFAALSEDHDALTKMSYAERTSEFHDARKAKTGAVEYSSEHWHTHLG